MARLPRDPQSIRWRQPADRDKFLQFLVEQIQLAFDARSSYVAEGGLIDTWHGMYEQSPRPRSRGLAWQDAADLASYIPTEKVDAMRARLVQIVFGPDPICTVEGWGEPAHRVAKVEAFLQWQAENERLQTWVTKGMHTALIEGNGILEVSERIGLKKTRTPFRAKLKVDEWQRPMLGEDLKPQPDTDESGAPIAWSGSEDDAVLDITRESLTHFGQGPQYRCLSGKDFLFLPVHARDMSEVWGYAKRIHLRTPDLQQRAEAGVYEREAVSRMATSGGERTTRQEHLRQGISIAAQDGQTVEHELWQVNLFYDVDGDGVEEWIIATVSTTQSLLLRAAFDTLEQPRFVNICPFPRADSVWGYSFVGHKLWTTTDEHTALRNMKADRQAMALNAPILRTSTSIWDPDDQPFGAGAVIDVRSLDEIRQMVIADVPASIIESERTMLAAAERLSGLNDTAASGVTPETRRTATEVNAVSQASFVRIDEAIRHVQESIEDLYQLRVVLWQRALEHQENGLAPPARITQTLELRGIQVPSTGRFAFTAADLQGHFRFKPRGSVETADTGRMRADFGEFLSQALPRIFQLSPQLAQQFAQNIEAQQELLEHALRMWKFPNLQVFLRSGQGVAAPQGVVPGLPPMIGESLPQLLAGLTGGGMGQPGQAVA